MAAAWVLVGHATLLSGFHLPVVSKPDLGVDLFIILSGFLMTFHYQLRRVTEPWECRRTWLRFWTRRWFRISPLYFLALAGALLLGGAIFEARSEIAALLPDQAQSPDRYLDHSFANTALHATYAFGLLPQHCFRTPLPDWSIGLEMQFYAVFPFLMLAIGRFGWFRGGVVIAGTLAAAGWLLDQQLQFPMPSFLPLKIHIFMIGMLIAGSLTQRIPMLVPLAVLLAFIPVGGPQSLEAHLIRAALALAFIALLHLDRLSTVSTLLGNRFFHWLGELSYGVYLFHLLIMTPIAAYAARMGLPAGGRFLLVLAGTVPLSYGLAAATYWTVERPGQRLGKALLQARLRLRSRA